MASLNKLFLMGNLTRDPDLKFTPKGTAVADIGIAINSRTSDGNGGWKEQTTFVDVTAWGATAENAGKYLAKGRGVFIEGRLQLDSWDDKATGQKRSKLKVVADSVQFLPDGKGGEGRRKDPPGYQGGAAPPPRTSHHNEVETQFNDDDDDIPF